MNYSITLFFNALGNTYPWVGTLALIISGPVSYIVFPSLVLGFLSTRMRGSMKYFSTIFLALFFSWLSARILKELFRVVRPFHTHDTIVPLIREHGYSFPSEHASVYGALVVILCYFDYRLGIIGLIVALSVVLSRLVVGVHYPIDVLVGLILGGLIAYSIIRLIKRII